MLTLKPVPGVAPADLEQFAAELEAAAGLPLRPTRQKGLYVALAPVEARAAIAADARARVADVLDNWTEPGAFCTCSAVHARLKTSAQVDADIASFDSDMSGGLFVTQAWVDADGQPRAAAWVHPLSEDDGAIPVRGGTAPRRTGPTRKRRQVATGRAGGVLELLQELAADAPVPRAELIAAAINRMPPERDARGTDRRRDYARDAIKKLTREGFAFEHPGDCIGLTEP